MAREIRKVPVDWEHPKDNKGRFIALLPGEKYAEDMKTMEDALDDKAWTGMTRGEIIEYEMGEEPVRENYMPAFDGTDGYGEPIHYQLYETTTGSPGDLW